MISSRKESLFNVLLAIQNLNEYNEIESFFNSEGVLIISREDQNYIFKHFNSMNYTRMHGLNRKNLAKNLKE